MLGLCLVCLNQSLSVFYLFDKMSDNLDVDGLRHLLAPGVNLQDAIDLLLGNNEDETVNLPDSAVIDLYVEPPEPELQSPEDSGNEEDEEGDILHLPGKQLLAPVQITIGGTRITSCDSEDPDLEFPRPSHSSLRAESSSNVDTTPPLEEWFTKRLKEGKHDPQWIEGDFNCKKEKSFPSGSYDKFSKQSAVEMFELFFTDEVWELLRSETQRYAVEKNANVQPVSVEELKCFVGILILSGYVVLPQNRSYWEQLPDMHNELVSNAMRRNRFVDILRYVHCEDNSKIDMNDKGWKLRKYMKIVRDNFLANSVAQENINYDESMVKYFGRHPMKQFIRGKPIRFGFKMWCLNSNDGYLLNFELYQGRLQEIEPIHAQLFGRAAAPLVKMMDQLPEEVRYFPYNIFIDNLFCGVNLFQFLREKGYSATGTFRENRLPTKSTKRPLMNPKKDKFRLKKNKHHMKKHVTFKTYKIKDFPTKARWDKMEKGALAAAIERKDGILFMRWKDNGVVTVGSTRFGVSKTVSVKRYSKEKKKNVIVQMPLAIHKYNHGMGGTDLMDQNIGAYRIGIRNKKWWWAVFSWVIDASIQNAWILSKKNSKVSQLQFRRELAHTYLTRYAAARRRPGPSGKYISTSRVIDAIRFDHMDHHVCYTEEKKRKRCAGMNCTARVCTMCKKCKVGLCIDCFDSFHSKF